jgi:hypothetical protein
MITTFCAHGASRGNAPLILKRRVIGGIG